MNYCYKTIIVIGSATIEAAQPRWNAQTSLPNKFCYYFVSECTL